MGHVHAHRERSDVRGDRPLSFLPIAVALIIPTGLTRARTLRVPAEFADIQTAIDNAEDGDTVLVARGIYRGDIRIPPRRITVTSEEGPEATWITASVATTVEFLPGSTEETILEGVSIARGMRGVRLRGEIPPEGSSPWPLIAPVPT